MKSSGFQRLLRVFQQNSQNMIITLLMLGIFTMGFLVSYLTLSLTKSSQAASPTPSTDSFVMATPAPINDVNKKSEGEYNFLLLGHGGAGHSGSLLTDSIIVVHIDVNTKKVLFITVPRDLWVPGNRKINAAGLEGFQKVPGVIQNVTGLPINYYVAIDFGGFTKMIDALGGVTVDIPQTFTDNFYPIAGEENNTCGKTGPEIDALKVKYSGFELEKQFTCRYEVLHYEKGPSEITGASALKIVRSRHGDSDFGRSSRQIAILVGIEKKLVSLQTAGKFSDIVDTLMKIVRTDINVGVIKSLVEIFGDPTGYKISHIQLTSDNVLSVGKTSDGQFILNPKAGIFNFSEIKNYIMLNLN